MINQSTKNAQLRPFPKILDQSSFFDYLMRFFLFPNKVRYAVTQACQNTNPENIQKINDLVHHLKNMKRQIKTSQKEHLLLQLYSCLIWIETKNRVIINSYTYGYEIVQILCAAKLSITKEHKKDVHNILLACLNVVEDWKPQRIKKARKLVASISQYFPDQFNILLFYSVLDDLQQKQDYKAAISELRSEKSKLCKPAKILYRLLHVILGQPLALNDEFNDDLLAMIERFTSHAAVNSSTPFDTETDLDNYYQQAKTHLYFKYVPIFSSLVGTLSLYNKYISKDSHKNLNVFGIEPQLIASAPVWAQWLVEKVISLDTSSKDSFEYLNVLISEEVDPVIEILGAVAIDEYTSSRSFQAEQKRVANVYKQVKLHKKNDLLRAIATSRLILINWKGRLPHVKQEIMDAKQSFASLSDKSKFLTLIEYDLKIECLYAQVRCAIRAQKFKKAEQLINLLQRYLSEDDQPKQLIVKRLSVLITYWRGVVKAHLLDYSSAKKYFKRCYNTVKEDEALVQLGFIALEKEFTEEAEDLLKKVSKPYPVSYHYLSLLIFDRKEKSTNQRIDSLISEFKEQNVHKGYLAALLAFSGRKTEANKNNYKAKSYYEEILRDKIFESDTVVNFRLLRIQLKQLYTSHKKLCEDDINQLDDCISKSKDLSYVKPLIFLKSCMELNFYGAKNNNVHSKGLYNSGVNDSVFHRYFINTLIQNKLYSQAQQFSVRPEVLQSKDLTIRFVNHILSIYNLCQKWKEVENPLNIQKDLQGLSEDLEQFPIELSDIPATCLKTWSRYLTYCLVQANEINHYLAEEQELELYSSELQQLYFVLGSLSLDEQIRQKTFQWLEDSFLMKDIQYEKFQNLIGMIKGYWAKNDSVFIEHYSLLEDDLSWIPWDNVHLFKEACASRLRLGQLDEILDGFIPDAAADFQNQEIRNLFIKAFVLRGIKLIDRDHRKSLKDIDQALDFLSLY